MDIAAGRWSTEMTILCTTATDLMDKYNKNKGRESSREKHSSCHFEREKSGEDFFFSFFFFLFAYI
jgi:hypothetical protein